MNTTNHVMVDIETLGQEPGCVILSIAAVKFSPASAEEIKPNRENSFYTQIDVVDSAGRLGFKICPETLIWWLRESNGDLSGAVQGKTALFPALSSFADWFKYVDGKYFWCHGAPFDEPILRETMKRMSVPVPWGRREVRDTRTMYHLAGVQGSREESEKNHNPVDDCLFQIKTVQQAYQALLGYGQSLIVED